MGNRASGKQRKWRNWRNREIGNREDRGNVENGGGKWGSIEMGQ